MKYIKKYSLDIIGTIIVVCLYSLYYYHNSKNYNLKFIAQNIEDPAFDKLTYFMANLNIKVNHIPDIVILGVNDDFLKKKELISNNLVKTKKYGSSFPKDNYISLIKSLDYFSNTLNITIKGLFIDYDLFVCTKTNAEISLISLLNKKRTYPIYFLHNGEYNCLEDYNINRNNIFVGAETNIDYDQLTRKYINYNNKSNIFISYLLTKHIPYNKDNLIQNKIIFKDIKDNNQSYWNNIYLYSADDNISKILKKHQNSIILYGATNTKSNDKKHIYNFIKGSEEKKGIFILADAIMTQYFLNGQLKSVPYLFACFIFLIIYIPSRIVIEKWSIFNIEPKKDNLFNILLTISITGIMFFILSWIILVYFKLWFNYYIPTLILIILKFHDILNLIVDFFKFFKKV